ncbi:hypothetical protein Barb4_02398 [Bacteroidales bacterium Barb4]|nr:hypothetical protein Barb4_02398 [Bacteroidales bacterium Barb4]
MNTSTITKSKSKSVQSEYRKHPCGEYTANDMIGAWEKGYKDGYENILGNISKITELANSALRVMQEFHANVLAKNGCRGIFLKMLPQSAHFIIALDSNIYFDDDICRPIYNDAAEITRQTLFISISFMPCTTDDSIDRVALENDYYIEITR